MGRNVDDFVDREGKLTGTAAEVKEAEDIAAAAVGVAVEESAAGAVATGGQLAGEGDRGGNGGANEESNDGELHFCGVFIGQGETW